MALLMTVSAHLSLRGRLKLGHALQMPDGEAEEELRDIEASPKFQLLRETRVLSIRPYANMRFAARRFAGWELKAASQGLPEVLNGRGDLVRLLEQVGQERFEEYFLRGDELTEEDRARGCGISREQARQLSGLVDSLYVQSEFEAKGAPESTVRVISAVAGVEIEHGRPVLAFFNRDIWKGRYEIDPAKRAELLANLPSTEAREVEGLLFRLDLLERRKSTLYQSLEALIAVQADYFISKDPARRVPFTQRELASRLGVAPSGLNMLISNKAIQLPWGLATPMKALLPSAKSLLLGRLFDLAMENPCLSDEGLGHQMARRYGAEVSRRSVAHYRSNLGIGASGSRVAQAARR